MKFQDLKAGYPVYIFDRAAMTARQVNVVSVSAPHYDAKIGGTQSLCVDVMADGKTFCMIADGETGYPGNQVISTGREAIVREVEIMKGQAETALSQVDKQKETVEKCKSILAELDPAIKERQANDERLSRLEAALANLAASVEKLI